MVATKRQRLDRETHRVDAKSLGQDVVALIFLFAAEPKARVVELKILRDEDDSDFSDDDYDYDDESIASKMDSTNNSGAQMYSKPADNE
ncbi:hypothetical protein Gpo141_00005868 [Globisporangium polare]